MMALPQHNSSIIEETDAEMTSTSSPEQTTATELDSSAFQYESTENHDRETVVPGSVRTKVADASTITAQTRTKDNAVLSSSVSTTTGSDGHLPDGHLNDETNKKEAKTYYDNIALTLFAMVVCTAVIVTSVAIIGHYSLSKHIS